MAPYGPICPDLPSPNAMIDGYTDRGLPFHGRYAWASCGGIAERDIYIGPASEVLDGSPFVDFGGNYLVLSWDIESKSYSVANFEYVDNNLSSGSSKVSGTITRLDPIDDIQGHTVGSVAIKDGPWNLTGVFDAIRCASLDQVTTGNQCDHSL